MIDAIELRKQVRVVLSTRKKEEAMPEDYLILALQRLFPERVIPSAMMLALMWNEARGWAEKVRNEDEERDEWKLSRAGREKEGV